MDQDDKPVGMALSRRDALRVATVAGMSLVLGRNNAPATEPRQHERVVHLVATPEVEEGPFFVDEELNRSDVTVGTTRKSVVDGSPISVRFTVYGLNGKNSEPLKGAHVDIWHADAGGTYSDAASGRVQEENTKGQKWLRGYQVTEHDGKAEFRTIYPGWYENRTPHIHVKIRTFDSQAHKTHVFNTQLFFDEDANDTMLDRMPYSDRGSRRVRNLWDGLYSMKQADGTMVGSHLHFALEKSPGGIVQLAHFAIALNLSKSPL
jgi:protocatechuate 3,4-dioxygenase beta subunit